MGDESLDRRTFLKGAAAIGTSIAAATVAAAGTPGAAKEAQATGEKIIGRPGSDFMVDVIKSLGIEYIASNPASSFRGLHESIVNYGGNKKPEFLTCCTKSPRSRWRTATPRWRASRWACWRTARSACSTPRWRSTTPGATACR